MRFERGNTSRKLRRRGGRGPCDGVQPGLRGQRGCSYGGGSRAPWRGDGCSAERSACSRGTPARSISRARMAARKFVAPHHFDEVTCTGSSERNPHVHVRLINVIWSYTHRSKHLCREAAYIRERFYPFSSPHLRKTLAHNMWITPRYPQENTSL